MRAFASLYNQNECVFQLVLGNFLTLVFSIIKSVQTGFLLEKEFFSFCSYFSKKYHKLSAKISVICQRLREEQCRKHSLPSNSRPIYKKNGKQIARIFFARACGARRKVNIITCFSAPECKLPSVSG